MDTETPAHHLWFTADHRALFTGTDQEAARRTACASKTLVQRTGPVDVRAVPPLPGASPGTAPAFGWDVPLAHHHRWRSVRRLASQTFPFQLFAFGTSHDPARAFLASRIILCATSRVKPDKGRRRIFRSPGTCSTEAKIMADSGVFRINPLQSNGSREASLKCGTEAPAGPFRQSPGRSGSAKGAHDGLLEVLDLGAPQPCGCNATARKEATGVKASGSPRRRSAVGPGNAAPMTAARRMPRPRRPGARRVASDACPEGRGRTP